MADSGPRSALARMESRGLILRGRQQPHDGIGEVAL